jgi:hypothetical protein
LINLEANLGPTQPRWVPATEDDIRKVVDSGLIKESHYVDAKRETGGSQGERKETARDLASYAVDGGALLFGVGEHKDSHAMYLEPQPLNGLIEKIDNIAAMLIDPPLTVVPVEIPSEKDPALGYVLAHIPPSPVAPHMVDGRYYARAERTRRVLQDSEVLRLHARRESVVAQVGRLLDAEVAREPVPNLDRRLGHLYFVAQPIGAPSALARGITRDDPRAAMSVVWDTEPQFRSQATGAQLPPNPREAASQSNRSRGLGLSSHGLSGPGRSVLPNPNGGESDDGGLLDIELRDDGGIRLLVGRGTMSVGQNAADTAEYILDSLAVAYTRRLVDWTVAIGERTGWRGSWMLGIHCDRLRGRSSYAHYANLGMFRASHFDEGTYREVTTASHLEMQQRPRTVARRVIGRLTETLGTFGHYIPDLTEE